MTRPGSVQAQFGARWSTSCASLLCFVPERKRRASRFAPAMEVPMASAGSEDVSCRTPRRLACVVPERAGFDAAGAGH